MPNVFKSTLFFEGPGHGWTETYWQQLTSNDYQTASDTLMGFAQVRRTLLGQDCKIKAYRVSLEDVKQDALLVYRNFNGIKQEPSAEQDLAILFTLKNATLAKSKNVFLRGFWDSVESDAGDYKRNLAGWKANMDAFKALFNPGGVWGWWGITAKVQAPIQRYIQLIDQRLEFQWVNNFFPAPLIGKRVQVRFTGINGKSNLNGLQVLDVVSEKIATTYLPISSVPYTFGGVSTLYTKDFIQATRGDDKRITTRKVGAPLLESHGRVKARPRV